MKIVGAIKRKINRIKKSIKKIKAKKEQKIKTVHFQVTLRCNYNCEYCFEKNEREKRKNSVEINASDEVVDGFINFVKNTTEKFYYELIGGEIFMHPRIFDIIQVILEKGQDFSIITNFSFPIEFYKKILDLNKKNCSIRFAISLHLSQVNLDSFLEKLEKLDTLTNQISNTNYYVYSILTEDNFETLKKIDEILTERFGHKLNFQNLQIQGENIFYNEDLEKALKKIPNKVEDFIRKYDPAYKNLYGTKCHAGHKWVNIFFNGEITRCFNDQKGSLVLGNIKSGEIKFFNRAKPCLSNKCCCCTFYALNLTKLGNKNLFDILYCWLKYDVFYKPKNITKGEYSIENCRCCKENN